MANARYALPKICVPQYLFAITNDAVETAAELISEAAKTVGPKSSSERTVKSK